MRMFSFCTCIDIFTAFLLLLPFRNICGFHVSVHPFSSGIHGRPYVDSMWCPLKQVFSFKMLYFAAFYVPSIYIPLCWHRSDQLASGHNAKHTDGMGWGAKKKKNTQNMWLNCGYWWHDSQTWKSKHLSILSLQCMLTETQICQQ